MNKPLAVYVEGSPCSIVIHMTEDFYRAAGSSDINDIGKFIIGVISDSFSVLRKGEPAWAAARLTGQFVRYLDGLTTLSLSYPPTKQDYLNNFKNYAEQFSNLLIYNCGFGKAKFVAGELSKVFSDKFDIASGRSFPHDFTELERVDLDNSPRCIDWE